MNQNTGMAIQTTWRTLISHTIDPGRLGANGKDGIFHVLSLNDMHLLFCLLWKSHCIADKYQFGTEHIESKMARYSSWRVYIPRYVAMYLRVGTKGNTFTTIHLPFSANWKRRVHFAFWRKEP